VLGRPLTPGRPPIWMGKDGAETGKPPVESAERRRSRATRLGIGAEEPRRLVGSNLKRLRKTAIIVAASAENGSGRPFVRPVTALIGSRLPGPPHHHLQLVGHWLSHLRGASRRLHCLREEGRWTVHPRLVVHPLSRQQPVSRPPPRRHRRGSSSIKKPTDDKKPGHVTGRRRVEDAGYRDAQDGQAGLRLAPSRAGWPASTPPRTDGTAGRPGRMLGRDGSGRAPAATSRRTRLAVGAAAPW
jgi:hypothetical protein